MHVLSQGENNYIENRKLPLKIIFGITHNNDSESSEVVIHTRDGHCERYNCVSPQRKTNLVNVLEVLLKLKSH